MIKGIQIVASALKPMMLKMEVVANNLANMNTAGYKKDGVFMEMMQKTALEQAKGSGDMSGYDARRYTDFSSGEMRETGNTLDCAIQGEGFFVVRTPRGDAMTRNGNFKLSTDGTLVSSQGYPVLGVDDVILIPEINQTNQGDITITPEGEVLLGSKSLGKLRVENVADQSSLTKDASSLFMIGKDARLHEVGSEAMIVRQRYLEESNVEGLDEMIQMVEMTRNFETGQKMIQYQDATLDRSNDVGRL